MTNKKIERINEWQAIAAERQRELLPTEGAPEAVAPEAKPAKVVSKPATSMRRRPKGDEQGDFFSPPLYDVGTRDNRAIMDVAVFRLSKKQLRANTIIRYDLPDGFVEVSSGAYGMASVWDYDIVLMAVSHLTEAMNRFREGKGKKPGKHFRPHVSEVLRFCRRESGGKQYDSVIGALKRLSTTTVYIERTKDAKGTSLLETDGESLIGPVKVLSNAKTGKVEFVQIKIADWMYDEVTKGTPDVLTVHPDYFLIEPALGRFLYRLARKAAGKDYASWGFATLHKRSGSTSAPKEFNRMLRELIEVNDLPEYDLHEKPGKRGPVLVMIYRASLDHLKEALANEATEDPPAEDPPAEAPPEG